MTSAPNELLKDPLFQLNAVLWLSQPLPDEYDIIPLFNRRGFVIYAIAPLLSLPPDVRLEAQRARISVNDGVRPDVVLTIEKERKFAFIECKASSFSVNSSTSDQARSLLIVAGPRSAEILGLIPERVSSSHLGLVVPETDHVLMNQTLGELQSELSKNGLSSGQSTVFGLQVSDTIVSIVVNGLGSALFALPSGTHSFMEREIDTDPRPLYFIPYDPDVHQIEQEKIYCKCVLFERMLGTFVSAVGHANPPTTLALDVNNILNNAMFGMYALWENNESARHMRKLCRQFMDALTKAVDSAAQGVMAFRQAEGWSLILQNQEQQDNIIDALTRFSCETLDLRTEPTLDLFDSYGGREP